MSVLLFIGSFAWGALTAQFLVQILSSLTSACIYLYGLLFSRVKKRLNAIFFATSLTQAVVFAILLVGGFWLIDLYIPYPSNADLAAAAGAFVCYFVYCVLQVPDKILVARTCAAVLRGSREGAEIVTKRGRRLRPQRMGGALK